jgi:hypothetical protein
MRETYDETLAEPKDIISMQLEDGGSRVTLECGHVIWVALEPVYLSGRNLFYCGACLGDLLQQVRQRQRQL